ncbi:hypothetical protein niasHS_011086 [Heterodera schachtii]|uniref:Metalloprotease TIKI homolog n=1 Tax=Heterodera schachtii TaxID=97005 RepID=A0ABD2ITG3_HETSC
MKMFLLRPVSFCLRFFAFSFAFAVFFAQNEKAQKAKSTFLWSIDSPSRNVRSFLFGTIHVPYDKVWQYVSPRVKEAFGAAEVIVFELELQNAEIVQQLAKCKQMERDANIKQWLPTQLYSRLKAFMHRLKQRMFRWHFQKNGNNRQKARQNVRRMFPSDWERRKPMWLLFLLLQAGDDQQWAMEDSERRVPMLDLYLAQLAHGQGKRILSVESVEEQCHPLESVKTDQLLFAINYTLAYLEWAEKRWDGKSHGEGEEKPKGDGSALAQLVELYKCGAMGEGMEERGFSSSPEADQLARHVDTLLAEDILLRRNERMARRADRLLRSHPSAVLFFAIGAGHLLGDRSILAHLRQLGYWMAPVGENDRIINAGPWESAAMAPDEIGQFWDLTEKQRKMSGRKQEGPRRRIALQIGELWPEEGKRNGAANGGRGTQRRRGDTNIWGPRQMVDTPGGAKCGQLAGPVNLHFLLLRFRPPITPSFRRPFKLFASVWHFEVPLGNYSLILPTAPAAFLPFPGTVWLSFVFGHRFFRASVHPLRMPLPRAAPSPSCSSAESVNSGPTAPPSVRFPRFSGVPHPSGQMAKTFGPMGQMPQQKQQQGKCRPIGHRYVIDEMGCDLFAVNVNICSGSCWSLSFVDPRQSKGAESEANANGNEPAVAVFAQCCRMVEAQMLNVSIPCEDGSKTVQIPSATNCSCFDCSRKRRRR